MLLTTMPRKRVTRNRSPRRMKLVFGIVSSMLATLFIEKAMTKLTAYSTVERNMTWFRHTANS